MEIKTKFDIWDTFYFMRDNKIISEQVKYIEINVWKNPFFVEKISIYYIYLSDNSKRSQDSCFKTKEELINSLIEN